MLTSLFLGPCRSHATELHDSSYLRLNLIVLAVWLQASGEMGTSISLFGLHVKQLHLSSPLTRWTQGCSDMCMWLVPGVARCYRSTARIAGDQTFLWWTGVDRPDRKKVHPCSPPVTNLLTWALHTCMHTCQGTHTNRHGNMFINQLEKLVDLKRREPIYQRFPHCWFV